MDYYQGVVYDYLRAARSLFLNTECCIQLNEGKNPDTSGPHWYCDAVVADFKNKRIFLCEISYSLSLSDLLNRLKDWNEHWAKVREALHRDSDLPDDWPISVWIFVPEKLKPAFEKGQQRIGNEGPFKFDVKVTALEETVPWKYPSWNRCSESD